LDSRDNQNIQSPVSGECTTDRDLENTGGGKVPSSDSRVDNDLESAIQLEQLIPIEVSPFDGLAATTTAATIPETTLDDKFESRVLDFRPSGIDIEKKLPEESTSLAGRAENKIENSFGGVVAGISFPNSNIANASSRMQHPENLEDLLRKLIEIEEDISSNGRTTARDADSTKSSSH
jgi:hypothetical protein